MDQNVWYGRDVITPQTDIQIQCYLNQHLSWLFHKNLQGVSKVQMEIQRIQNSQNSLKVGEFTFSNSKNLLQSCSNQGYYEDIYI